ncbi:MULTISPECIES: DUF4347 domain-containing protein [unclassified Myxococcus]|uniref:DUF4347 domain-containing protein n=1 Tax=Myxococcus TaxID=32 RepID=UPI001CBAD624|nr:MULTISPECIES: DUF4347 domain-containing protein [unclassified Myxococcus]MBZ4400958.1 DUF4347 domain-containing protein [Myxococcus sp. AS-1-15]MBZ4409522.1 DUF4347 domain-containing protein [Myxococcus sp. XM-1-1-1]
MKTHLTVVSYTRDFQTLFETIADVIELREQPHDQKVPRRPPTSHALVERCQYWQNLPNIALNVGRPIDLLDLVGHGSSEEFELGDDTFLVSAVEPPGVIAILKRLKPHLAPDAQIRLLGCGTGVGESGLKMLKNVSRALEREVFGTTVELLSTDFVPGGLSEEFTSAWLYSSRNDVPTAAGSRDDTSSLVPEQPGPWTRRLPGFEVMGRGEPLCGAGFSLRVQGKPVTVSADRRWVFIKDEREQAPLMLRWPKVEPAPALEQLLSTLR